MVPTKKIILSLIPFAIAVALGLFLRISEAGVVFFASGVVAWMLLGIIEKFSSKPIAKTLRFLQFGVIIIGSTTLIATLLKLWFLKP